MRVKVLGSAAGGGFPQWNCDCRNCRGLRDGTLQGRQRTQMQLAIAAGKNAPWFLVNASPDLRQQIVATPELAPVQGRPPIAGVVLTSADVDAVMGLLHLREFTPLGIFATPGVQRVLTEDNSIFRVLARAAGTEWIEMQDGVQFELHADNAWAPDAATLRVQSIAIGHGYPEYVSDGMRAQLPANESVAAVIFSQRQESGAQKKLLVSASLPGINAAWLEACLECDVVLADGTFWSDGELQRTGRSAKRALEIGHIPLAGPDGLLAQFPKNTRARKILIHINNTNPILDEASEQRRTLLDAGWDIAYDGMEFEL
jgi:pyrroloquinoline quinone biosynthesis protein B